MIEKGQTVEDIAQQLNIDVKWVKEWMKEE
jgi:DNA-binding NarL/FixJ family response regulator